MDAIPNSVIAFSVTQMLDLSVKVALLVILLWLIRRGDIRPKFITLVASVALVGCAKTDYAWQKLDIDPIGVHWEAHIEGLESDSMYATDEPSTPPDLSVTPD